LDSRKRKFLHVRLLDFEVDGSQSTLIHRIAQGYDSIFIAGTGHKKRLIFVGLASLLGRKTTVIVCPLKVFEMDQVRLYWQCFLGGLDLIAPGAGSSSEGSKSYHDQ